MPAGAAHVQGPNLLLRTHTAQKSKRRENALACISGFLFWISQVPLVNYSTRLLHINTAHKPKTLHRLCLTFVLLLFIPQTPYFWPSNCWEPENTDYGQCNISSYFRQPVWLDEHGLAFYCFVIEKRNYSFRCGTNISNIAFMNGLFQESYPSVVATVFMV